MNHRYYISRSAFDQAQLDRQLKDCDTEYAQLDSSISTEGLIRVFLGSSNVSYSDNNSAPSFSTR